jgi:hypothetical protein
MGTIVAIPATELLKAFVNSTELTNEQPARKTGVHLDSACCSP